MPATMVRPTRANQTGPLGLARVLLVQDGLASRLALQTILQAGGYFVDVAASIPEALSKLDAKVYELVLSDQSMESQIAGGGILSYARLKEYRPATGLVNAYQQGPWRPPTSAGEQQVSVPTDDVSSLLSKVAELIGLRASRRSGRLRQSGY